MAKGNRRCGAHGCNIRLSSRNGTGFCRSHAKGAAKRERTFTRPTVKVRVRAVTHGGAAFTLVTLPAAPWELDL